MTCPLSSQPQDCLAFYRRQTAALTHSWETIQCTTCRHLRVNGELVPRPKDETIPFKSQRAPRRCTECGGKIGPHNKSGVCQACVRVLFGNRPKRERVPQLATRIICPSCGGTKFKRAVMCSSCRKAKRSNPAKCTAPGCTNKTKAVGLCYRHYRDRRAA